MNAASEDSRAAGAAQSRAPTPSRPTYTPNLLRTMQRTPVAAGPNGPYILLNAGIVVLAQSFSDSPRGGRRHADQGGYDLWKTDGAEAGRAGGWRREKVQAACKKWRAGVVVREGTYSWRRSWYRRWVRSDLRARGSRSGVQGSPARHCWSGVPSRSVGSYNVYMRSLSDRL